jgi:hypothetical protein
MHLSAFANFIPIFTIVELIELVITIRAEVEVGVTRLLLPLWRAAGGWHESVVKLLLETGKVDADSKDKLRSDTAVAGGRERARSRGQAAARDWQGRRRLNE